MMTGGIAAGGWEASGEKLNHESPGSEQEFRMSDWAQWTYSVSVMLGRPVKRCSVYIMLYCFP